MLALLAIAHTAHAFNIDFGTVYGTPPASYGAAAGQAGTWNPVGLGTTALSNLGGGASGVSANVGALSETGSYVSPTNDDQLLLNDNFFSSSGGSWSVSLSGLADGDYRIYLYAASNPAVPSGDMIMRALPVIPSLPGDPFGSLTYGASWVSVVATVTGGALEISGAGPGFSGLAGLQVMPLPEPGSTALLGSGAALLALLARRRVRPPATDQPTAPGSTRSPVRRTSASARLT